MVTNIFAFLNKHIIDLTDMLLHLAQHPLMLLVKQILHLLPVNISNID